MRVALFPAGTLSGRDSELTLLAGLVAELCKGAPGPGGAHWGRAGYRQVRAGPGAAAVVRRGPHPAALRTCLRCWPSSCWGRPARPAAQRTAAPLTAGTASRRLGPRPPRSRRMGCPAAGMIAAVRAGL